MGHFRYFPLHPRENGFLRAKLRSRGCDFCNVLLAALYLASRNKASLIRQFSFVCAQKSVSLSLSFFTLAGLHLCAPLCRSGSFADQGLATPTLKHYRRVWRIFIEIVIRLNLSILPTTGHDFDVAISDYTSTTQSYAAVLLMVAAVSHFHARAGFASPASNPQVRLTLRGIRRSFCKEPKRALPLTPNLVRMATELLEDDCYRTSHFEKPLLLWRTVIAMVFSFSSLARFDCMTRLKISHLSFEDNGANIFFPSSKTDQFRTGQNIFLKHIPGSRFCPVFLLKSYTLRLHYAAHQANAFPFSGFLFPAFARRQASTFPTDKPFSRQGATKAFRDTLSLLPVPDPSRYTLHSGRRGGATNAALMGCDFLTIKRQGRWKSGSCPQMYIDEAHLRNNHFTSFLGL